MRKIIGVTLSIIFLSFFSCKKISAQEKFSDQKAKEMLKNFYTAYIKTNSVSDYKRSDSVVRRYCTLKLVSYIDKRFSEPPKPEDNGDVFLKGNMVDMTMLEGLTVRKDLKNNGLYYVEYGVGPGAPVIIKLSVVKENEDYKIARVFDKPVDEK